MRPILFLCGFIGCLAATGANAISLVELKGYWYSPHYIKTLIETRSPIDAARNDEVTGIDVQKNGDAFTYLENYRFHEGAKGRIEKLVTTAAGFRLQFQKPSDFSEPREFLKSLKTSTSDKAIILVYQTKPVSLERLPTAPETFAITKSLAGTYKDETGKMYSFSGSGKAKSPQKSFNFKLNMDATETERDYIFEMSGPKRIAIYGFRWEGQELLLLQVRTEAPMVEKDAATLHRLKPISKS